MSSYSSDRSSDYYYKSDYSSSESESESESERRININDYDITDKNLHLILYKAKYNNDLKCVINENRQLFKIFNDSYKPIYSYLENVKNIIKELKEISVNIDVDFFIKSYYTLLSSFKSYEGANDGKLRTANSNNPFTIGDVTYNDNSKKRIFFKIIDYDQQYINSDSDICIIDILSAIIFETIFKESKNFKYRDFIPVYTGSFLSYLKFPKKYDSYWVYDEVINIYEKYLTPYNFDSILNSKKYPQYYDKCIVISYEAIPEPISIMDIFINYNKKKTSENLNLITKVLSKICDIYDFLIYLGTQYGFMHNDLHFGNIIYNSSNDKLMIIDFGRSSFGFHMLYKSIIVDNCLLTEYLKLNFNEILKDTNFTNISDINDHNVNKTRNIYANTEIFRSHYTLMIKDKFYGIMYDLISLALNMYFRLIYYFKNINTQYADIFEQTFSLIIKVNYNNDINNLVITTRNNLSTEKNLDKFMDNYLKVKTEFVDVINHQPTKRLFKMLLEGLSYASFYFHATDFDYFSIWMANQVLAPFNHSVKLGKFLLQLFKIEKYMKILSDDTFLMYLANSDTTSNTTNTTNTTNNDIINGGTKNKISNLVICKEDIDLKKIKKNKIVSLERTSDLYENISIIKMINSPPIMQKKEKEEVMVMMGGNKRMLKNYK
jgi:thiamine kinase-like enzyme